MKRFFKSIAIILLVFVLATPASALAPLAGYLLWSLGAHVAVGAAYYIQGIFSGDGQGGGSAAVTPDGTIGRGATVQWVDLTSGLPEVKMKEVTVKANASSVMDAAKANPTKYPKLKAASQYEQTAIMGSNLSVGSIVKDVSFYKITGNPVGYSLFIDSISPGVRQCAKPGYCLSSSVYWYSVPVTGAHDIKYQTVTLASPSEISSLPIVNSTPAQFAQKLANSSSSLSSPANVFSDYYGEIDEYIKEFPGNVSVVDTPDPLTVASAPSATLPTPATQTAITAAESKAASAAASAAARESANGAVSTAQLNYNNNPTAENEQKLKDAIAARDKLLADQSKDAAGDAEKEASEEEDKERISGSGFVGDDPYGDTEKDFDLGKRFKTFFDEMKTTAVFSLPNEFLTNIPSSSETSISFNGGRFGVQTFDFATFSSLWNGLKAVILVAFGWFAIRIAVLKGGSS